MESPERSKEAMDRISQALLSGRKLEAIKHYRELTGQGLKESKDAIDTIEGSLKKDNPGAFTEKPKSSGPVFAVVLALIVAGIAFSLLSRS
jgi:ribosomal protein L7/L12